jgi:hypothetical protein
LKEGGDSLRAHPPPESHAWLGGKSQSIRRHELEAGDAGDDQADAQQPRHARILAKQNNPEDGRADRSDARPNRIAVKLPELLGAEPKPDSNPLVYRRQ